MMYFADALNRFDFHNQLNSRNKNATLATSTIKPTPTRSIKILALLFLCTSASAQINKAAVRLGINYGVSSQSIFPFNSPDYSYCNKYIKIQVNYLLKQKRKWKFELNVEPSFYVSKHQLLNLYYIQPNRGPDYLSQRDRFTKLTTINEYTLNFGTIIRYDILNDISIYLLGSIGPMISDEDTERLPGGFAFSDIVAFGTSYKIKKILLDIRVALRHASNAGLYYPNDGHNSSCLEAGFSVEL